MNSATYASVPTEMRAVARWLCWTRVPDPKHPDKPRKVPAQARRIGLCASSTDPSTWATFADACAALRRESTYAGLGFALGDGYAGVDLDHCVDRTSGELEPWARAIVERLNSYTEYSPSGTGVHIIVRGELPKGRCKSDRIEMYCRGRYFTVTGRHVEGTPIALMGRTPELAALHAEIFRVENQPRPVTRSVSGGSSDADDLRSALSVIPADDRELWLRVGMALHAAFGDAGFALWNEWSARSEKYNERDQRYTWKHFRADGGVSVSTVYYLAQQYGWRPPVPRAIGQRTGGRHTRARAWEGAAERARLETGGS